MSGSHQQVRHGTAAAWTTANPTLAPGELGFETDTGALKVGNGATAWASLGYLTGGVPGPVTSTTAALTAIGNAINTTGKTLGKPVWNTDTHAPVYAGGTTAGAHWYSAAGADTHTPV